MKKTFNFGKIDYFTKGKKTSLANVTIEYKEKGDKKVFSASGDIWQSNHRDILCGGQCLDELNKYLKGDETFDKIYRLWKLYHLNDMHAECEHQRELGWEEIAEEQIYLYHWSLNIETIRQQDDIKKLALNAVKKGETFTPTKEQSWSYNLDYRITTEIDELPEELKQYYKSSEGICCEHVETKNASSVYEKDHSKGILCKPCPVCGYKYGSSWLYEPIPVADEKIIYELLEGE